MDWIKPEEASKLINLPVQQIRLMLRSGEYEWLGIAFKRPNKKRFTYYVNPDGIKYYLNRFKS